MSSPGPVELTSPTHHPFQPTLANLTSLFTMAKASNNNKRKANGGSAGSAAKKAATTGPKKVVVEAVAAPAAEDDDSDLIGGVIFPEELESTIEVLTAISQNPEMLKSKQLKGFKGAMWDAWRALQETTGTGPYDQLRPSKYWPSCAEADMARTVTIHF